MADKPISTLAQILLEREMAAHPEQFRPQGTRHEWEAPRKPAPSQRSGPPLTPEQAAVIGGLVDAASTYTFLKRGTGTEGNALALRGSPEITALGAVGGIIGTKLLRDQMRKVPGLRKLADILAAQQGGAQLGLGLQNFEREQRPPSYDAATGSWPQLRRKLSGQ